MVAVTKLLFSMYNQTADVEATVAEILRLEEAGCQVVRVTVNNEEAAAAIKEIKKQIHIPLVADIHFNYKLALLAIENGIDKVRINPGNIGKRAKVERSLKLVKKGYSDSDRGKCRFTREPSA